MPGRGLATPLSVNSNEQVTMVQAIGTILVSACASSALLEAGFFVETNSEIGQIDVDL